MSSQKIKIGHFVNIQAFKYNGTLYRQWNGVKLFSNNNDYVCCILNKTKVVEKDGQKWTVKEPTLWFFSKKNFFNVTILWRKKGLHYYINLASPFFIENETIKYIDFDYDVKIYPEKFLSIVDHVDFSKNKEKWYDDDTVDVIYKNLSVIAEKYHQREDIFDNEYIYNIFNTLIDLRELSPKHFEFKEE